MGVLYQLTDRPCLRPGPDLPDSVGRYTKRDPIRPKNQTDRLDRPCSFDWMYRVSYPGSEFRGYPVSMEQCTGDRHICHFRSLPDSLHFHANDVHAWTN